MQNDIIRASPRGGAGLALCRRDCQASTVQGAGVYNMPPPCFTVWGLVGNHSQSDGQKSG